MTTPERRRAARRATAVGIAGNAFLFLLKGGVAVATGSIALLSDAFNSLVDVVTSIAIYGSVVVAHREPDADHPFGHHRAETIAALGVAIFTAILGFEIGRAAVERLLAGPAPIRDAQWAVAALAVSMAGNLVLARYLRRRGRALESPAILANAVECENDIGASLAALVGVVGARLGWPGVDPAAGIVVGLYIVWGGYRFGRQNIDYLMGKSPAGELLDTIRARALGVPGVRGVHDVRAHYVGHRVHVELHVEVDEELRTRQSHDVGSVVRHAVENLAAIDRAFVHVDPVLASTRVLATLEACERAEGRVYEALARRQAAEPALAALWQALATDAAARAERLALAQRLKGAGWHFGDDEVGEEAALGRRARLAELEGQVTGAGLDPAGAVDVALELASGSAREAARRAAEPLDSAVAASLAAATLPGPSRELLRQRLAQARAASDPVLADRFDALARTLAVDSP
jgi:cation diffusion facilitator family transporter